MHFLNRDEAFRIYVEIVSIKKNEQAQIDPNMQQINL